MSALFINILKMSITASYTALAVILIRAVFRRTPKVFFYAMWFVVFFRLVCPFSFYSALSIFTLVDPHTSYIQQSLEFTQPRATEPNRANQSHLSFKTPVLNDKPKIQTIDIVSYIWLFVILVLLLQSLVSYTKIKGKVRHAVLLRDNIFDTERISTPFVFGFLQPKIYLPLHLEPDEMQFILRHEQTHIRRRDYLIKPLAYMVLLMHWFNPLIWLSFILMEKDMEMSCDESVMKHAKDDIRINYARTLLSLSINNGLAGKTLTVSPLPFGEGNVKTRIKNVLRYKKRTFWINALTIVLLLVLSISLITNTLKSDKSPDNQEKAIITKKMEISGLAANDENKSLVTPSLSNSAVASQVSEMVNENISIIMSSPKTSSNPQDYIEAHRENYENIIKYGDDALTYLLEEFESGDNNDLQAHIKMSLCKELLGNRNNVFDDSLSPQEWYNALSIREESKVPDFVYSGTNAIDMLVYNAAMQQYSQEDNGFTVVAPTIHDYFMSGNKLKIFVTVYSNTFRLYDKTLSEAGGSIIPAAITYSKNEDGSYQLEEYLEASDGAYFESSIKEYSTLPDSEENIDGLAQRIMADYGSNEERSQLLFKNLKEHLLANKYKGITLKQADNTLIPIT